MLHWGAFYTDSPFQSSSTNSPIISEAQMKREYNYLMNEARQSTFIHYQQVKHELSLISEIVHCDSFC
jgi:hypothetical protein